MNYHGDIGETVKVPVIKYLRCERQHSVILWHLAGNRKTEKLHVSVASPVMYRAHSQFFKFGVFMVSTILKNSREQ